MKRRLTTLTTAFFVSLAISALTVGGDSARAVDPTTLVVDGDVVHSGNWDAAHLRRAFATDLKDLSYTVKDKAHTARQCVPLWALVRAASPRANPKQKNALLSFVVRVRGRDGYTTVFSLGELSPDHGNRAVWLALDRDGADLSGADAPAELIAPDDKKPSRDVRGIAEITILPVP